MLNQPKVYTGKASQGLLDLRFRLSVCPSREAKASKFKVRWLNGFKMPYPFSTGIYKSPDGDDCLYKTWQGTKLGTFAGVYVSLVQMTGGTTPKTLAEKGARVIHFTAPAAAMGFVFAATPCIIGGIRGKDDPINHALGGAAAGFIVGAKMGSVKVGCGMSIALALAGALIKIGKMDGWDFNPGYQPKIYGSFHHYDKTYHASRREVGPPAQ